MAKNFDRVRIVGNASAPSILKGEIDKLRKKKLDEYFNTAIKNPDKDNREKLEQTLKPIIEGIEKNINTEFMKNLLDGEDEIKLFGDGKVQKGYFNGLLAGIRNLYNDKKDKKGNTNPQDLLIEFKKFREFLKKLLTRKDLKEKKEIKSSLKNLKIINKNLRKYKKKNKKK